MNNMTGADSPYSDEHSTTTNYSSDNYTNTYENGYNPGNSREYSYDNLSKDGKNWGELKIKYLNDTGKKDSQGDPIVYVYFECSYFKGEYKLEFGL